MEGKFTLRKDGTRIVLAEQLATGQYVKTIEGTIYAPEGYWLITEATGAAYVVSNALFQEQYKPFDGEDGTL